MYRTYITTLLALLALNLALFSQAKPIKTANGLVSGLQNGDPNGPGLPQWKKYEAGEGIIMDLGDQVLPKPGLFKAEVALLERLYK